VAAVRSTSPWDLQILGWVLSVINSSASGLARETYYGREREDPYLSSNLPPSCCLGLKLLFPVKKALWSTSWSLDKKGKFSSTIDRIVA
jgi:hypothetical protein